MNKEMTGIRQRVDSHELIKTNMFAMNKDRISKAIMLEIDSAKNTQRDNDESMIQALDSNKHMMPKPNLTVLSEKPKVVGDQKLNMLQLHE